MDNKLKELKDRIQELETKKAKLIKQKKYEEAARIRDEVTDVNENLKNLIAKNKD